MTMGAKIKKARNKKGLTQLQLAQMIEADRTSITQYEGDSIKPTVATLKKIADVCEVDMLYFFEDEYAQRTNIAKKELTANPEKYVEFLPEKYQLKDTVLIPKLELKAGAGSEGVFDIEMFNAKGSVPVERHVIGKLDPKNLRAIEIVGDSMEPEFYEKDIAIMDMVNHRYDFVRIAGIYIVRTQEAVYIKRVDFMPKGGIKMMSINRNYGDIILTPDDDYEILGKVCGKVHYEIYKGLVFDNQGIK
jgi:putative transcriptional regulator|nr:MAG TPA: Repressor protein CI [Caudoviricetes sp.]